jgi:hypothetical protein
VTINSVSIDYCSRACVTAADCGGPLPKCVKLQFANPSGIGSTFVNVCAS